MSPLPMPPSLRRPLRGRGFTMIELMVTIAVLVILILLAAPAFTEMIASQRVQTASADLITSLARARSEAIKQNLDVTITPNGTWAGGWIVASTAGNLEVRPATSGIAIGSGPASVTFRSNGRLAPGESPKFSFSASSTGTKRCVQVGLSGQPVVTKVACT